MFAEQIKKAALDVMEEIISIRRHIHMCPELGFQEFSTSSFISGYLTNLGLEVKSGIAQTGVTGLLRGNTPGKTLAIRADIDALPIIEETGVEYSSKNKGIMHACGHDAHIAIVLGTAKVLSSFKHIIKGNIKFIFQPGEEGMGGARNMIEEGSLTNPEVDAIIAAHVFPVITSGKLSVSPGYVMASQSEFEITIKGKGGHAAEPHNAVDPIIIGANLVNLFQSIISRSKNPLDSAVLSVTCFNSGSASNIIPDNAIIKGTVRTFDVELNQNIAARMESLVSSVTSAMGAGYEFIYKVGYPPVYNDPQLTAQIIKSAGKILGEANVDGNPKPKMVAEDFSYYALKLPGVIFNLGCSKHGLDKVYNLHNSKFNIDESCLQYGVEVMTQFAFDFLNG